MLRKIVLCLIILVVTVSSTLAAPAPNRNWEREIKNDVKGFDGKVGIYAKNLVTGRTIDYNENAVFPTASTSKLVVALATYKYLYPQAPTGKRYLYDTDIQYMMTVSDNPSFYELLDEIAANDPAALSKVTRDLGLRKTQIHSQEAKKKYNYQSVTTPYEMAKVFGAINTGKYLGKEKSQIMKDQLANTIFRDEIPRHMQVKVMHKVGQLDNILCDTGIVDDGKDQILISFYTITDRPAEYASNFIADTSAKLYNALRRK